MPTIIKTFLLLNILDCITTYIGLQSGLMEANFLLSGLFNLNIFLGLGAKMAVSGIVAFLLAKFNKLRLLKIINVAFAIIVIWNLSLILIF